MKAKEVRIGNLLKKDGVVVTIDGRSIFDMWCTKFQAENYDPISLTPECLERFGFIKKDIIWLDKSISKDCYQKGWYYVQFDGATFFCKKSADQENIFLAHIQYVHQLQNLYFALTGEELQLRSQNNPQPKPERKQNLS